jgi:hypothetical protein
LTIAIGAAAMTSDTISFALASWTPANSRLSANPRNTKQTWQTTLLTIPTRRSISCAAMFAAVAAASPGTRSATAPT